MRPDAIIHPLAPQHLDAIRNRPRTLAVLEASHRNVGDHATADVYATLRRVAEQKESSHGEPR
jgi:hypothetical protein